MKNKEIRIAITGGGSGGHMYPLLAVAESINELKRYANSDIDINIYYFGNSGIYTQELIKDNVKILSIHSIKIRRYFSLMNVIDIIKFPFVLLQAMFKMFLVMPNILFSKGGTASFPVVLSAWFFHIPIFIHESDTVPGLSNRLSYKFAKRVGVSFEYTKLNFWNDKKTAVIGNPIRPFLLEQPEKGYNQNMAKKMFEFDPLLPSILILGGSLGSQRINAFLLDNIEQIISRYQVLHVTGQNNFKSFKAELAVAEQDLLPEQRQRYKIVGYLNTRLKDAIVASDIVISRAGSGTIFEISYFGKPSILIPLKKSAGNHQLYNAYEYSKAGASTIIEENNLTTSIFFSQLKQILSDKNKQERMSKSAKLFSKPNASYAIAKEIFNIVDIEIRQ